MAKVVTMVAGTPAAYQRYALPSNYAGQGWQLSYSTTYAALTSLATDYIQLPQNSQSSSVVYSYTGAATATLILQVSNNTREEVEAGTAVWSALPANFGGASIAGGASGSAVIQSSVRFLRALAGGTGNTGADAIAICVSAVSRIDN